MTMEAHHHHTIGLNAGTDALLNLQRLAQLRQSLFVALQLGLCRIDHPLDQLRALNVILEGAGRREGACAGK